MIKTIGTVESKNSGIIYQVGWQYADKTAWVRKDESLGWSMVCTDVSEKNAIKCAKKHIDFQSGLF